MQYANDPFWVRLRWVLFIAFWVIWWRCWWPASPSSSTPPNARVQSPSSGGRRALCTRQKSRTSPTRITTARVTWGG